MTSKNDTDKVIVGKDNFLFLGGADSNDILSFITGTKKISDNAIRIYQRNIQGRSTLRCPIHTLIVPESHLIYSELLPESICLSQYRPIHFILPIYGNTVTYPIDELRKAKTDGVPVYTGNDSHWTENAALVAYLAIRKKMGLDGPYNTRYRPEPRRELPGDLRSKIDASAPRPEPSEVATWSTINATIIFSTRVVNHGYVSFFRNPAAPSRRLLVFGTSFSNHFLPFVFEDFSEVIMCYGTSVDFGIVNLLEPDQILIEMPERFVHRPSVDDTVGNSTAISIIARSGSTKGLATSSFKINESLSPQGVRFAAYMNQLVIAAEKLDENGEASEEIPFIPEEIIAAGMACRKDWRLTMLFGGFFRNENFLYAAFQAVDDGYISASVRYVIPPSEVGILTSIRLALRSRNLIGALMSLNKAKEEYDESPQFLWYKNYIENALAAYTPKS